MIANNIKSTPIKKQSIEKIIKDKDYRDVDLFVTNEDLKDFIHGIHNFMRNNGFGYGKRALETFNFFYGLKLIENKLDAMNFSENEKEKIKYREIFNYKNLIKLAEKRKMEFYGITNTQAITDKLEDIIANLEKFNIRGDPREPIYKYIYHDIPNRKNSIKEEKWYKLIKMINKLPVGYEKGRVNLSGKVYEYFIGKDKSALSDLGAYFTDRHITEEIYKKLDIELDDKNNVKTMIDPFGGSGGFTLGYANYLMDNYKEKIDWSKNVNNIYHFDMEEYVINMTGLEMFAITGELPNTNEYNYSPGNTFTREFNGENQKYDYVISNPPYGGDSINKGAAQIKNDLLIARLKKNMDDIKTHMKKHVSNSKKMSELVNSINRLNIIIKNASDKKLYEQNTHKFNKLKSEYTDNDELCELINKYKKNNEQLSYLNYKLKKHKEEQEKMQVNYGTSSDRIRKFTDNANMQVEEYVENENKYVFVNGKMRPEAVNDKEACSLILLMDLVKKNGTCCAVLKEGVFFDSNYSELRNVLINNYNVSDIISVDQDSFENTSTKTSIIIFKNNGKTKLVNFSELKVSKTEETKFDNEDNDGLIWQADFKKEFYENTEIYDNLLNLQKIGLIELNNWDCVNEMKGEIQNVNIVPICKASYKDISSVIITKNKKGEESRKYEYSLNYKNYNIYQHFVFTNDYKLEIPESYTMIKLGDVLEFIPKSKHKASIGTDSGKYRFYTSSDKIKFSNICDIDDDKNKYLIFGDGGVGSLFIDNKFARSDHNIIAVGTNNTMTEYIYYYIKKYWVEFIKFHFSGSTIGNIKKENLINTQIPIPKDISTLKKELTQLQKLHQAISVNTELIPEKEKAICDLIKKLTDEGKEGVDYESKKLGDVCEVKAGPYLKEYKKGIYPIIGGGNISGYIDKYSNENEYVIHKDGISSKIISYIRGKFFVNHHGWTMTSKNNISKKYIGYWINIISKKILDNITSSVQKGLNQQNFYAFEIKILKPSILTKHKLQQLFDEVDELKDALEADKLQYQTQLKVLFKDFEQEDEELPIENGDKEEQLNNEDDANEDSEDELEHKSLNTIRPNNKIKIEDEISNKSSKSAKSAKSVNLNKSSKSNASKVIIAILNGMRCVEENREYYLYDNNVKGDLYAIKNANGDIELVEQQEVEQEEIVYKYLKITGEKYILIDNDVYTISNDKPHELYGYYVNKKFTKLQKNNKIIVKGKTSNNNLDDLEAELNS